MKPSEALATERDFLRSVVTHYRTANPRIFGSVLHGHDREGSDLDLLVDPLPGATLFDLGGLQEAIHERLGISVDVVTPDDLPARFRARVLAEARPV